MTGLEQWDSIFDDYPVLHWTEHVKLAKQRDEGGRRGQDALEKLVLHNLRAIVSHVDRMNCRAELRGDLFAAGIIGLRKAAVRWQPIQKEGFDQPAPFATSAFLWIKEAVVKEARKNWHDHQSLDAETDDGETRDTALGSAEDNHDHLSLDVLEILSEKEREILKSRAIDFREETDEELALRLGIKPHSVCKMLSSSICKLLARAA